MGTVELGRRLRALRAERGLSLSQMEARTGISRSFLGLVEQGRSDISITRLLRLARAYDITLDELAREPGDHERATVVRAGEAPVIRAEETDVAVLLRREGDGLAASILSSRPGSELAVEQTMFGEALFFVLQGLFSIAVGDEAATDLDPGDALFYRGPVRLAVRCREGDPGRVLCVGAGVLAAGADAAPVRPAGGTG